MQLVNSVCQAVQGGFASIKPIVNQTTEWMGRQVEWLQSLYGVALQFCSKKVGQVVAFVQPCFASITNLVYKPITATGAKAE